MWAGSGRQAQAIWVGALSPPPWRSAGINFLGHPFFCSSKTEDLAAICSKFSAAHALISTLYIAYLTFTVKITVKQRNFPTQWKF